MKKCIFTILFLLLGLNNLFAADISVFEKILDRREYFSKELVSARKKVSYIDFKSSGLPLECLIGSGRLQNSLYISFIKQSSKEKIYLMQILGEAPAPFSEKCWLSLYEGLAQLKQAGGVVLYTNLNEIRANGGRWITEIKLEENTEAYKKMEMYLPENENASTHIRSYWICCLLSLILIIIGTYIYFGLEQMEYRNEFNK